MIAVRAGAPDAGLPGLAGLGTDYAPLGSLMAQAGRTGAADPAAAALAGARQELASNWPRRHDQLLVHDLH